MVGKMKMNITTVPGVTEAHIGAERVEERRNKTYGLKVTVSTFNQFNMPDPYDNEKSGLFIRLLRDKLKETFRDYKTGSSAVTKSTGADNWRTDYRTTEVAFFFSAERPKDIISELTAVSKLNIEEVVAKMAEAVEQADLETNRQLEQSANVKEVHHYMGQVFEVAKAKAKEKVNYAERLKALQAEAQAELGAEIVSTIAEFERDTLAGKHNIRANTPALVRKYYPRVFDKVASKMFAPRLYGDYGQVEYFTKEDLLAETEPKPAEESPTQNEPAIEE